MQTWQMTVPETVPLELQQWCRDVMAVVERVEEKASAPHECDQSLYQDVAWQDEALRDAQARVDKAERRLERAESLLDAVCLAVGRDEGISWSTRKSIAEVREFVLRAAQAERPKPVETVRTDKV